MSTWQKISLRDAVGKVVFDDEWGFIRFDGNINYTIGGTDINNYFIENAEGQKVQLSVSLNDKREPMSVFSKILYYRNPSYGYYYRNQEQFVKTECEEIVVNLTVRSARVDVYGRSNSNTYSFNVKKQDKKRLEYLRYVWICDEIQDDKFNLDKFFKQPLYKNLKVDDEILLNGKKHLISVVYDQPNENGYMFAAVPSYEAAVGKIVNVTFSDKVNALPYKEQPASEIERFNNNKNELDLSPYAVKMGQIINVFWNKIDDAAEYTVALLKKYDRPYLQKIYHIKDYVVDRNDGFISIDGLLDEGYIVVVKAENRAGEEIALSRGILLNGNRQCVPQYWKE